MSLFTKTLPALLFLTSAAFGGTIVGGSGLLTESDVIQLDSWYGGSVTLTNIFVHNNGDGKTSTHFHTAADGKGATIAVVRVTPNGGSDSFVIGGYNPQSWDSTSGYNRTEANELRTGFVFNLTTATLLRQRLTTDPGDPSAGEFQTFNADYVGPTFGGGYDLTVASDLASGTAYRYSYGACPGGSGCINVFGETANTPFTVSDLEVFSVEGSAAPIPEPGTWALLGTGFTALATIRRRRN